ncbi:hypothetical protein [Micromonospora sp. NPDC126480]|uniref:hypothetical protein n=1 Tax=Micromonospora sp. NPDC126480 TaxID=3155312 RepID=UPI003330372C
MTDFDREQATYWFDQSCRYARLIGGITSWADAPLSSPFDITPELALAAIRRLLAEHREAVTSRD